MQSNWIDVEDRLPERTSSYLVFVPIVEPDGIGYSAARVAIYYTEFKQWYVIENRKNWTGEPEYWMELPEDPM